MMQFSGIQALDKLFAHVDILCYMTQQLRTYCMFLLFELFI